MLEVLRRGSLLPLLLLASNTVYATASRDGSGSSGRPGTATAGTTTTAAAASSLPVSVSAGAYNRPSNSTCISGTVNYITHTLPQQCLRTDRTSANGTQTSSTSVGAVLQTAQSPAYNHTLNATSKAPIQETTVSDNETAIAVSSNGSSPVVATSSPTAGSVNSVTASRGDATLSQDTANGEESLFDSAAFLSFEEWKKQNLAKTGQSPDNVGQERAQSGDRQRPGIHNALDTLGEDSEIDLDFAGFGNAAAAASSRGVSDPESVPPTTGSSEAIASGQSTATSAKLRSRDAGKTCKARTNYASFDCAATVMKQNAECKHASSILVENKDSYMLNKCSASNKFFIVELCNDIHIDTVVLANYEFFSSIFRHFRVSVSDRYPVKADKWKELGTFEARNTREVQAFLIEEPQIWARYLRVEFLTHYGSEYYCPVSLLRVHGRTMMQEFRQEEEMARGELSDEEATLETEGALPVELQEALTATDESEKATVQAVPPVEIPTTTLPSASTASSNANTTSSSATTSSNTAEADSTDIGLPPPLVPTPDALTCAPSHMSASASVHSVSNRSMTLETPVSGGTTALQETSSAPTSSASLTTKSATSPQLHPPPSLGSPPGLNASSSAANSTSEIASQLPQSPAAESSSDVLNTTRVLTSSISTSPSSVASSILSNSTRNTATASSAPQASSQESFFKSISKRLQQLESNSTLSLQYIEEQSRILRDAFNKVEKRQISATKTFLSHLNETVMTELHGFRQAYDQLWQGTVIELEGQREQYQREMLALSSRLTLVADELVWQKRLGIMQSTLLLVCLALVLFARQGNTGYVETTLAQQLMSRSQAALRAGWESDPNSPSSPASRSPVSIFRRKLWRSSTGPPNGTLSEDGDTRPQTRDGAASGVRIELPTPAEDDEEEEEDSGEASDGPSRTQSSPPAPERGLKRLSSSGGGSRTASPEPTNA